MKRNRKLERDYKRLDIENYKGIIKDTLVPFLDELEGEYITTLTPETEFTIQKQYHENDFMGWNIYANGVLLETKSTKRKARKFIRELQKEGD